VLDQTNGNWLADNVKTIIDVAMLLVILLTGFVSYRVNVLLFSMKIPERLAVIESELKNIKEEIRFIKGNSRTHKS
jgi:hypothetical protein